MKFYEQLKANSVAEWKHKYIDYDKLKKLLLQLKIQKKHAQGESVPNEQAYLLDDDLNATDIQWNFFKIVDEELTKVNDFYLSKEVAIRNQLASLNRNLESLDVTIPLAPLTIIHDL